MRANTYEYTDLLGDETVAAVLADARGTYGLDEIAHDGPKFLDAIATDLSLDDVVLDLDDIYN